MWPSFYSDSFGSSGFRWVLEDQTHEAEIYLSYHHD